MPKYTDKNLDRLRIKDHPLIVLSQQTKMNAVIASVNHKIREKEKKFLTKWQIINNTLGSQKF